MKPTGETHEGNPLDERKQRKNKNWNKRNKGTCWSNKITRGANTGNAKTKGQAGETTNWKRIKALSPLAFHLPQGKAPEEPKLPCVNPKTKTDPKKTVGEKTIKRKSVPSPQQKNRSESSCLSFTKVLYRQQEEREREREMESTMKEKTSCN